MIKKLFSMAVVAIIAMSFASCSNDDEPIANTNQAFKINFQVADMPSIGANSRSIKTGWEDGDQIFVIVDGTLNKTITLEYDGSAWTATKNGEWECTGDTYDAVHFRGDIEFDTYNEILYNGGEIFTDTDCSYTVSGSEINLGTITLEIPTSFTLWDDPITSNGICQISIPGLDSNKTWVLSVASNPWGSSAYTNVMGIYCLEYLGNDFSFSLDIETQGYYTGTDHIFWFIENGEEYTSNKYYFIVYNIDDNTEYVYEVSRGEDEDMKTLEPNKAYTLPALDYNGSNEGNWKVFS